jgi:propanol-preferring alcohol dehydrogenase
MVSSQQQSSTGAPALPQRMRAMVMTRECDLLRDDAPLELRELPVPRPGNHEVLLAVKACGVCHTELDEIEGRTPPPRYPVVPGHEVVGDIVAMGAGVTTLQMGMRVGVGWIHHSDGSAGENVSEHFTATGRDVDGGYAQYMCVPEAYAYPIPARFSDQEAAPLLCAGAIGYRALALTELEDGQILGLTGFGGSAHLVLQLCRHLYPHTRIFVFARDEQSQAFARQLGADWAGHTEERAPAPAHAIIDTTPAWTPVLHGLANLRPGGRLVINAIRKEDNDKTALLDLSYHDHLWLEREIKTVANITAADIRQFLAIAAEMQLQVATQAYPLEQANQALVDLKRGTVKGAKVLVI